MLCTARRGHELLCAIFPHVTIGRLRPVTSTYNYTPKHFPHPSHPFRPARLKRAGNALPEVDQQPRVRSYSHQISLPVWTPGARQKQLYRAIVCSCEHRLWYSARDSRDRFGRGTNNQLKPRVAVTPDTWRCFEHPVPLTVAHETQLLNWK